MKKVIIIMLLFWNNQFSYAQRIIENGNTLIIDLGVDSTQFNGNFVGEEFVGIGDINGDGYDDYASGHPRGGRFN